MKNNHRVILDFFLIIFLSSIVQFIYSIYSAHEDLFLIWIEGLRWRDSQFIYSDFGVPWGPVSGLLSYIFLLIFFDSISLSYFFSAILIHGLSCIIIYFVILKITKDRFASNIAAYFNSFWFLTQIGGLYVDHLSYFFILVTILIYVLNISKVSKIILLSIFLSLSFWTKQTTGALGSLIAIITYFYINRKFFFNSYLVSIFLSINFLISILILSIIFLYSSFDNFLNSFLWYNLDYSKVEENKNPLVLIYNFIAPFKIDIISAIYNKNLGVIVFYPLVILVYLSYLSLFIFRKYFRDNINLFSIYFFFLFSSLLCMPMIGRNFVDVVWSLGGVFGLNYYVIKKNNLINQKLLKKIFIFFLLIFIFISLLHFIIPKVLTPSKIFNDHSLYPLRITENWGNYVDIESIEKTHNYIKKNINNSEFATIYLIDDKSILFSILNKIPTVGYNTFFDANINIPRYYSDYLDWQKDQINYLRENDIKYIVSSLKNKKRIFRVRKEQVTKYQKDIMNPKLIIDFIKTRYNVIYTTKDYTIFEIKK